MHRDMFEHLDRVTGVTTVGSSREGLGWVIYERRLYGYRSMEHCTPPLEFLATSHHFASQ